LVPLEQQIGVTDYGRHAIVEVMRQTCRQLPHRLQFFDNELLAIEAPYLANINSANDKLCRPIIV